MSTTWPERSVADQTGRTEERQRDAEAVLRRDVDGLVRLLVRRGRTTAQAIEAARRVCEDTLDRCGR